MKLNSVTRTIAFCSLAFLVVCPTTSLLAQSSATLEQRIKKIMDRPEFVHSRFGIEFYSLDTGQILYALNSQQLFTPGSTTKLLTEGTALEYLGANYRFHTPIYRTGPIQKDGSLDGDLVLVGTGDPDLSNRIQPDGTLAFEDEDHAYGGPDSHGLPGDPLLVMREFARQIAQKGIKRVNGRILVDATLFAEGKRELGTNVFMSPVMVNDNLIDIVVAPATTEGAPVTLRISPQTSYAKFINHAITGKAGSRPALDYSDDKTSPDGTHTITIRGSLPIDTSPSMEAYRVPEPSRYAAMLLKETLKENGISAKVAAPNDSTDFKALAVHYKPENLVAEHLAAIQEEEVKVTLKVSQNMHASVMPFVLGAMVAHAEKDIDQAGFDLENAFLTKAGLDLTGASQSDGAGGNAFYTPDFMTHYLFYMSKRKDFPDFYRALPVLGKDGTLAQIQVNSPAAGHVHAKTGTIGAYDLLNKNLMVRGKGLAGYMETADGRHLVLAIYANMVSVPLDDPEASQKIVGQALGEIAAAAYDAR